MNTLKKAIAFNLCLLFLLTACVQANGAADNTNLSLIVNEGSLAIVASSTASFSDVSFSFTDQTSTSSLGDLNISDTRGNYDGWIVNITVAGTEWATTSPSGNLDYDGDGVTTGQLSLDIPELPGDVTYNANGQDTTGFTMGDDESFGPATSTIQFVDVNSSYGGGDYWIHDFKASQFIPGNTPADTYTLSLVLTAT